MINIYRKIRNELALLRPTPKGEGLHANNHLVF